MEIGAIVPKISY